MMNKATAGLFAVVALLASSATAQTTLTYLPGDGITDTTAPLGVSGDAAPGFGTGSFTANGSSKSAILIDPSLLFGRAITIGEIASMSYYTKQTIGFGDVPTYLNWYLEVYTTPDGVDDDAWYGRRLNFEPYFSMNPSANANEWTQWSTDAGTNQLRVFDANRGTSGPVFGTFADPTLQDLKSGAVDWSSFSGAYDSAPVDYRDEQVWFMGISTGSGWAAGFEAQVDGFRIQLDSGEVGFVDFEAVPSPASAGLLAMGGLLATRRRRAA